MPRSGKTERGRRTRARIAEAATRLFVAQGYLDTTMAAIAAEAGVAVQTLYLAFGSKAAILAAAHDRAVAGDDVPLPVLDRPWVAEARAAAEGLEALTIVVDNALAIVERVSPIYGVIQAAAADPDVGELLERTKAQRLATVAVLADVLAAKPGFASTHSVDETTDILYGLISDELHRLLAVERSWSPKDWKAWVHRTAAFHLFPGAVPSVSS